MQHSFNELMTYIDDHLLEPLSDKTISQMTGVSAYHFKRMFSMIAGLPLSTYIKQRRLAAASAELAAGAAVTTVAFKYGYQSVEGFSRAFRAWTGQLPSTVAATHWQKSFPRFNFFLDVRGGTTMDFKIVTKPAFNLVGVAAQVPLQFNGENAAIQKLAQSITPAQRESMHKYADLYPQQVLNASYNFQAERVNEGGQLTHLIGFATSKNNTVSDLTQVAVPAATWAIFPVQGPFPATLQTTWGRIYSEWLPDSGYEVVPAPEISFTKYDDPQHYSEIWIAVRKVGH